MLACWLFWGRGGEEGDGIPAQGSWQASDKKPGRSWEEEAAGTGDAGDLWPERGAMANGGSVSVKEATLRVTMRQGWASPAAPGLLGILPARAQAMGYPALAPSITQI